VTGTELNSVLWRAYELPLREVRVLILGQDPYPDPDRAAGLSFSTGPAGDIPDSLANIYADLGDAGFPIPSSEIWPRGQAKVSCSSTAR
jgi:uracil-DNA glycosylase